MLPSYYDHVCRYENSLVTKFFGVHCVKPIGGQKVGAVLLCDFAFCYSLRYAPVIIYFASNLIFFM